MTQTRPTDVCRAMSPSSWMATDAGRMRAGLPRTAGHKQGVEALARRGTDGLRDSASSISRSTASAPRTGRARDSEVSFLLDLIAPLHPAGCRRAAPRQCPHHESSASASGLEPDIVALLEHSENLTPDNSGLTLIVAFNYGSRQEIARAARDIARAVKSGLLSRDAITPELIDSHLDTRGNSRSRSTDPHQRRAAPVQLSPVAVRLYGVRLRAPNIGRISPERFSNAQSPNTASANAGSVGVAAQTA